MNEQKQKLCLPSMVLGGTKLKIIRVMLALAVVAISMYGLLTKDFSYSAIASLLLGFFFAIMGIEEYKLKGKNGWGLLLIIGSIVIIVMALFSLLATSSVRGV